MATHVLLLRGINVGGRHRLPMAQVREVLSSAGFVDVRTYIQSGNVVLCSGEPTDVVAARVRSLLEAVAGFDIPVVGLSLADFDEVLARNPFEPSAPKLEHVVLLPSLVDEERAARIVGLAAACGESSEVAVVGRAVYVHHPDGLMQSAVAQKVMGLLGDGTARNLGSMTAIAALAHRL